MLPLVLAAIGALKGSEDAAEAKKEKQAEAVRDSAMIRWSPWSGVDANKFAGRTYDTPSGTSSGLAGAAGFAQTGQNFQNSEADNAYRKAVTDYYKNKTSSAVAPTIAADPQATKPASFYSPYGSLGASNEDLLQGQAVRDTPYNSFGVA